ncbi:sulfurtransferase [Stutzerimonas frequens]|uniref:rhodanese-like domain-containing protein n=1 Tax=Stutzerimonas frequens TaxID=2968969 RepID=UPI002934DA55|nr:rhodanese-like domain-containing protein [Stutzerimonas frequens]WOC80688.1 sulfurtransferase [Stutzerimonas frequens]
MSRISICELAEWQAADRAFTLLDVRRTSVRLADAEEIPDAHWRDPEAVFTWKDQVPRDRPAIIYCAKGHEISQGIAATLEAMGLDARFLIDGFAGWYGAGRPTRSISR